MTMQANLTNRGRPGASVPGQVVVRAAPRGGRAAALARGAHIAGLPPGGPVFVSLPMDDWDAEVDEAAPARRSPRRSAPGRRRPGVRPRPRRPPRAATTGSSSPAPASTPAAPGTSRVALAERRRLPVWATPAPGGGRLGFPEDHPDFRGVLPPAIGPVGQTLEEHDLVLVVGSSVFPYYPHVAGPRCWPREPSWWRSPTIPTRRCGRRWATRSSPTCADPRPRCSTPGPVSDRAPRPPRDPVPRRNPETGTRSTPRPCTRALAEVLPEDAIVVLESPSSTLALRNRCASRDRALLLLRRRRARLRPARLARGPARAARAARSSAYSARARRSTRSRPSGRPWPTGVPVTFLVLRNRSTRS